MSYQIPTKPVNKDKFYQDFKDAVLTQLKPERLNYQYKPNEIYIRNSENNRTLFILRFSPTRITISLNEQFINEYIEIYKVLTAIVDDIAP
jgi:hypothetical protein